MVTPRVGSTGSMGYQQESHIHVDFFFIWRSFLELFQHCAPMSYIKQSKVKVLTFYTAWYWDLMLLLRNWSWERRSKIWWLFDIYWVHFWRINSRARTREKHIICLQASASAMATTTTTSTAIPLNDHFELSCPGWYKGWLQQDCTWLWSPGYQIN